MAGRTTDRDAARVTTTTPLVRFSALAAPTLLLLYGLLRWVDGLDGDHGPGLAWNVGHTLFLISFVLLGVLAVGMRGLVPATAAWTRTIASLATVLALFGVGCFLWVIVGDLFPGFGDSAPLPDALEMVGPPAFQLGVLTLLILLAAARPRRLPIWSPPLVLLGFAMFAVNLDLIPAGALLILAGLAPLAGDRGLAAR